MEMNAHEQWQRQQQQMQQIQQQQMQQFQQQIQQQFQQQIQQQCMTPESMGLPFIQSGMGFAGGPMPMTMPIPCLPNPMLFMPSGMPMMQAGLPQFQLMQQPAVSMPPHVTTDPQKNETKDNRVEKAVGKVKKEEESLNKKVEKAKEKVKKELQVEKEAKACNVEKTNDDDHHYDDDEDDKDEDVTDVKAFVASLKTKATKKKAASGSRHKVAQSSSSDDEEGEEDEDEDDDDDDDEEDLKPRKPRPTRRKATIETEEEEDTRKRKRKVPFVQKKKVKSVDTRRSGGRRKGSINKKPTKAEIERKLEEAEQKITMEAKLKAQEIIELFSDSDGDLATTNDANTKMDNSSVATTVYCDDDPVWQIPEDDYSQYYVETEPEDVPFVDYKTLDKTELNENIPHPCKACKVSAAAYLILPCKHFGLCDECKERYEFTIDMRCAGCGDHHFVTCDKPFF